VARRREAQGQGIRHGGGGFEKDLSLDTVLAPPNLNRRALPRIMRMPICAMYMAAAAASGSAAPSPDTKHLPLPHAAPSASRPRALSASAYLAGRLSRRFQNLTRQPWISQRLNQQASSSNQTPKPLIPHPSSLIHQLSSLIPHPSSLIPHPSSLIHQLSSLIPHPSILEPAILSHQPSSLAPESLRRCTYFLQMSASESTSVSRARWRILSIRAVFHTKTFTRLAKVYHAS